MSLFQTNKPKSVGKHMIRKGPELDAKVLDTLESMSEMSGITLGPGGRTVIIERPEMDMKPIITKDGVTVIKNLGYESAVQQLILEAARDAAVRTADEAGDGTTTATILSSSIARATKDAIKGSPNLSPQKIVRELQALVPFILDRIEDYKIEADTEEVLKKVATLSANGDELMADAVMEAFDIVGEEGNITIVEIVGSTKFEVEKIKGYTVEMGFERSCKKFATGFINDPSGTKVVMNSPYMILFDGIISDVNQFLDGFNTLKSFLVGKGIDECNIVLCAHGFSDAVIGTLHLNWNDPRSTIKILPLLAPEMAIMNYRTNFLYDLQAYTGLTVFNPINNPILNLDAEKLFKDNKVKQFECSRFRSSVISDEEGSLVEIRVAELKRQLANPESEYEAKDLEVRIGKLTSGIARLNIYGLSAGELRERRDRAEDAWMAMRGAIKHGALPGGGYVYIRLAADLFVNSIRDGKTGSAKVASHILSQALSRPFEVLYENYGWGKEEIETHKVKLLADNENTYDIVNQCLVPKGDLLDSLPAVSEAIKNSISIASLLGTLGGIISFKRDFETDKEEEDYKRRFERAIEER